MLTCFAPSHSNAIQISLVNILQYETWLATQKPAMQSWLTQLRFKPEIGASCCIPNSKNEIEQVICCVNDDLSAVRALPLTLPEGHYYFSAKNTDFKHVLAWGLGAYQFTRYKKAMRAPAVLVATPDEIEKANVIVSACYLTQDLINTPTDDMGPSELSLAVKTLSKTHHADFSEIVGEKLLKNNYSCIYTVGRASDDAPRLLDLRWGDTAHPKVTLVGKGVCFDTGGLDLKPSSAMLLMKKDMGGAAHVLGLAQMIMQANLPISLRVLIPAVENAVSGNAYRPGDVIKSRQGMTIEVGNTDAEGRLVLADALTEAVSEKPALLIDMATLTGAARVALGPDLPALFANNDGVAEAVIAHGNKQYDPLWRMPLFSRYREYLNSTIADINNNSSECYGGAITAALFLKAFVPDDIPWLHIDLMAYNTRGKPGRMIGADTMGLRALFAYLQERFVKAE